MEQIEQHIIGKENNPENFKPIKDKTSPRHQEKQIAFEALRFVHEITKNALLNEKDRTVANNAIRAMNEFIVKTE